MRKLILLILIAVLSISVQAQVEPATAAEASAKAGAQPWTVVISSPFGWRISPITHQWEFHPGIDVPATYGTPIEALFDGIVVWAGSRGGYGNTVILQHDNNTYTLYGHCAQIHVTPGQTVKAGDIIALVGSTGMSTGPHLHLEYWVHHQYIDPLKIWQK